MRLLLYDGVADARPARTVAAERVGDGLFEAFVPGAREGQLYLWSADGDDRPLLDPYALALTGPERFGADDPVRLVARVPHAERNRDARFKCAVIEPPPAVDWERPRRAWRDEVVYELHVRGFTRHPSSGASPGGTFRDLAGKAAYLADLGVTCVELMPVHEFDESETRPPGFERGTGHCNFWGYSPLNWFAPNRRYAADAGGVRGPIDEFRAMVRALHGAGIAVIADVVFNHTAELDAKGPTLSFRGLDPDYYLAGDFTGCGNTVNAQHPDVRRMVLDALRWWHLRLGVDGFRFDLAAALARGPDGRLLDDPPLFREIEGDPWLADARLVAEPWDAAGGYLVTRWPGGPRWSLWNDRFRDDVRRAFFGEPRLAGVLATRLCGSADLFGAPGSGPPRSLNFVTAHDGFTLFDAVSYARRHNEANGEGGRDGNPAEPCHPHGPEGQTNDPAVRAARDRCRRSLLASLLLAQGVPMLLAGDEMSRTQRGNNNAYCFDSDLTWVDWRGDGLRRFVRGLVAFRRARAALRRERWLEGRDHDGDGFPDVLWVDARARPMTWHAHEGAFGFVLSGARGETGGDSDEEDLLVLVNLGEDARDFALPAGRSGAAVWRLAVDTGAAPPDDFREGWGASAPVSRLRLAARAIAALVGPAPVLEGGAPAP